MGLGGFKPFQFDKAWDPKKPFQPGSVGLSLLNLGRDSQNKREVQRVLAGLASLEAARKQSKLGFAQAEQQAKRALPLVRKTFDDARENAMYEATSLKRGIAASEKSRLARADMQLDQTGLGDSSARALMHRGVFGQSAEGYSAIDEAFSQQAEGLAGDEASALGGAYGRIGAIRRGGYEAESELDRQAAELVGGMQTKPQAGLADFIGTFGGLIGGIFGGKGAG